MRFCHKAILIRVSRLVERNLLWRILARSQEVEMERILRSVGHGLLAAGVFLLAIYLLAISLKGPDALYPALDLLRLSTYLSILLPIMPGTFLIWLSDRLSARKRKAG